MADKYIVTVARQFGSLGRPIARQVSERLNIGYYDRDIVEIAAKNLNLPVSTISDAEESARSVWLSMKYPLGTGTSAMQDAIFSAQRRVITDLASKESCIIVGRCGDHILRDLPNVLNVFIYAPFEARLKNCVDTLGMKPDEAKKMIASVDRARESYHRHYCGYSMSDKNYKHLMIDSQVLGEEGTCDILTEIIRRNFGV